MCADIAGILATDTGIVSRVKRYLARSQEGINDVPVLARADVGIAMGGLGSDAGSETTDLVIMADRW